MSLSNRAFALVDALLALIRQTKSNLQMALSYLEGLGYTCCAEKLKTSDFGVPQRRDFLLKDDDRVVLAELNHRLNAGDRRAQRKASSEPGPSSWAAQQSRWAIRCEVATHAIHTLDAVSMVWSSARQGATGNLAWAEFLFQFHFKLFLSNYLPVIIGY